MMKAKTLVSDVCDASASIDEKEEFVQWEQVCMAECNHQIVN